MVVQCCHVKRGKERAGRVTKVGSQGMGVPGLAGRLLLRAAGCAEVARNCLAASRERLQPAVSSLTQWREQNLEGGDKSLEGLSSFFLVAFLVQRVV